MINKEDIKVILATDCGSTTTKAIMIELLDNEYRLTYRGEAPTTVEAPFEDVTRGVLNAIIELEELSKRKILNQEKGVKKFSIFINKASSELEAKQNFEVFSKNLVHKFLDARAYYAGFLPMSKVLKQAVIMKKPVMIHNRKSKEGIAFQKLAGVMLKAPRNDKKGICFFE